MLTNLYLAYTDCNDVARHIEIDSADILGFNDEVFHRCSDKLVDAISTVRKSVVAVPRGIVYVDSRSIDRCVAMQKSVLPGCIPLDTASARRLAKIGKIMSVVVTAENIKFVNESQVNFMAQSSKPKYIEVHLYPFVLNIVNRSAERDVEKDLYSLGRVLEHALKRDVGVIPTAASPALRKTLLATHLDVILYTLGFSKRERRLMLEFYPLDLVQNWLNR